MIKKLSLLSTTIVFVASSAMAQNALHANSLSEPGQSQFAAIAEIVEGLRDDPETDWTKVNIDALREHLVDMDNVTTKSAIDRTVDALSVTFVVNGDDAVAASIQRMVLAHSPLLRQSSGWTVVAKKTSNGAAMTVQVKSKEELSQVLGLGFFGLMTIGAHHQQHHLMIASGQSPH